MPKQTLDELYDRFTFKKPTAKTGPKHEMVTQLTLELATKLNDLLPEGRNLAIVLTLMEEVRMRSNAAIACDTPENER